MQTLRLDARGKPSGFLLISSDITDEVRLTQKLDRLRYAESLLESAPDAMVIVNSDGEIQLANAATEKLFGYPRDQLLGQPVELLIPERFEIEHPAHRDAFFTSSADPPDGGQPRPAGLRKDGS